MIQNLKLFKMHFEAFRAAPTKQAQENKNVKRLRQTSSVA
jgi:hypothetical protein